MSSNLTTSLHSMKLLWSADIQNTNLNDSLELDTDSSSDKIKEVLKTMTKRYEIDFDGTPTHHILNCSKRMNAFSDRILDERMRKRSLNEQVREREREHQGFVITLKPKIDRRHHFRR